MRSFLLALQFLTVIPIKIKNIDKHKLSWSMVYFPIVGLLLGLILINPLSSSFNSILSRCILSMAFFKTNEDPLYKVSLSGTFFMTLHADAMSTKTNIHILPDLIILPFIISFAFYSFHLLLRLTS
ncbi:hypothetical protein D4Q80_00865 [bacterium]|nr:MAG: hypothetical protein D4Q80_00865 [bacterium]